MSNSVTPLPDQNHNVPPASVMVLDALPHPVIMVSNENHILYNNVAAEAFFHAGSSSLQQKTIQYYLPFSSPLLALIDQVRHTGSPVNEYKVDVSSPRLGNEQILDLHVAPVVELPSAVVILFQKRTIADKMDRQLTHRSAARTVSGLAAMLAHEIKNPLAGIRGAAQLLEMSVSDSDREFTNLIKDETDRIVKLVDRMEVFSDERPIERDPVNIHSVFERVITSAKSGFARNVEIIEKYDPSLPPVFANRDQLIQIFLNLAKNSCEAMTGVENPRLTFSTAFRSGVHLSVPGSSQRVSLPLEFCVTDNGHGVPDDMMEHLFDPFMTTKTNGSGLGLALVAKVVGDHGGVVECESKKAGTTFRVLLPAYSSEPTQSAHGH